MSDGSTGRPRPEVVRWAGLSLLTLLLWGLAFAMVAGLNTEYGAGVVDVTTIVGFALVGGVVLFALTLKMFAAVGASGGRAAVVVGVIAAAGAVGAGFAGQASGAADHDRRQQATAASCDGDAQDRTLAFAREVGRVGPMNGNTVSGTDRGCHVNFVLPKTEGVSPVQAIDEALGDDWRREGESTWVAGDGFRVETRIEQTPPDHAEDEVDAWGMSP